jgi:hypothetical protein
MQEAISMTADSEPFFSWTSRRVVVACSLRSRSKMIDPRRDCGDERTDVVLDVRIQLGVRGARLLGFCACETDYVALLVGDVVGARDVPIHVIDEEQLLIVGSRSTLPAEILVGIPADPCAVGASGRPGKILVRQVCMGGPIRDVLALSGVHSVIVDVLAPDVPAA